MSLDIKVQTSKENIVVIVGSRTKSFILEHNTQGNLDCYLVAEMINWLLTLPSFKFFGDVRCDWLWEQERAYTPIDTFPFLEVGKKEVTTCRFVVEDFTKNKIEELIYTEKDATLLNVLTDILNWIGFNKEYFIEVN